MSTAPFVDRCPVAAGMALLGSGVPLSLLLDLACGPRSEELLADERAERARGGSRVGC